MKKQLTLLGVFLPLFLQSESGIEVDFPTVQGYANLYTHTFELKNKEKKPTDVKIYELAPDGAERLLFDKIIGVSLRFGISYLKLDPKKSLRVEIIDITRKKHSFLIKPDKDTLSVLVKYEKGKLKPQIGTYGGLGKYTASGLPLVHNIKSAQIEKLS